MAGLVDAVVDAAAEVLDEGAEEAAVDRADGEVRVEGELGGGHGWSFEVEVRRGTRTVRAGSGGYLRAPSESPPCQYFCRERNAMTSGMTETSEPMMIRPHSECAAAVVAPRPGPPTARARR